MDKKFNEALEEFINQRINDLGEEESDELSQAAVTIKVFEEKLTATLRPEQIKLWNEYETAYSLLDGETVNFYYRAGFADALSFIFKMKGGGDIE